MTNRTKWTDAEEAERIDKFMNLHKLSGTQVEVDEFGKLLLEILKTEEKNKYNQHDFPILDTEEDEIAFLANNILSGKVYRHLNNVLKDMLKHDTMKDMERVSYEEAVNKYKKEVKGEDIPNIYTITKK